MATAQSVNNGRMVLIGMALSNGLVGLAGSLFAQSQGIADVSMGIGTIVTGLAALIIGETLVAIGEAFALARAADVDPARVRKALLGGFAGSRVMEMHGQRLLDDEFVPGFMAHLHAKDMGIVANTAAALGLDLSGVERVRAALSRAIDEGHAYDDSTILARYCCPDR